MPAEQIHLVRHGEVFNPQGVLYGRLPGYGLSDLGRAMAEAAALDLVMRKRDVAAARAVAAEEMARQSGADLAVIEGGVPRRIEIAALAREVAADEERRAEHAVQGARANLTMAREDYERMDCADYPFDAFPWE